MWFKFMIFASGLNIGTAVVQAALGNWPIVGLNVVAAALCWPWGIKESK